jgi:hypothetical protein
MMDIRTRRDKLAERKGKMLTVAGFRAILRRYPDDTPVGIVGHFGEFYEMDPDHCTYEREAIITPSPWQPDYEVRERIRVVALSVPRIGPSPD